jgi:hypothetical protein
MAESKSDNPVGNINVPGIPAGSLTPWFQNLRLP